MIATGVSLNLDADILQTVLPLLEDGQLEAIEWSFDALYTQREIPKWFADLLHTFGDEGRLLGHGIFFSLFSGSFSPQQEEWLNHLSSVCQEYQFAHVTEHFGFMTGEDFHKGAPLSIPDTTLTRSMAANRLQWISHSAGTPVGLENLAFAFQEDDVLQHGDFLQEILRPVNGFIILDLHNIYCQVSNFAVSFSELINKFPLELVREIHLSGGSWDQSITTQNRKIRRDTHNDRVPLEVFEYLQTVISLCPNLRFVILEQLGTALHSENKRDQFRNDFRIISQIVKSSEPQPQIVINDFMPHSFDMPTMHIESQELQEQQRCLSEILENADSFNELKAQLGVSILKNSTWKIEDWPDYMLETAWKISRKWR